MGRKVNPIGFRLGVVRDWQSKWHTDKHYVEYLQEDIKIREAINKKYGDAGVSLIEIERPANKIIVNVHTSRPGIVIGRGGQRVDETRRNLEELIGKKLQLNVQEIRQPELDAYLVARSLAEQIERRVAYRRAMKQALFRSMQAGAQGIKINVAGRLGGAEIARSQVMHQGRVPLHTIRADVDYGFTEAHTLMGRIGIKVWLYRGDILPEQEEEVFEAPISVEAVEDTPVAVEEEVKAEVPAKKEAPKVKTPAPAPLEEVAIVAVVDETPVVVEEEAKAEVPAKEEAPKVEEKKKTASSRKKKAVTDEVDESVGSTVESDEDKVVKKPKAVKKEKAVEESATESVEKPVKAAKKSKAVDDDAKEAKKEEKSKKAKPVSRTKTTAKTEVEVETEAEEKPLESEKKAKTASDKKKKAKTVEEEDDASTEKS
jgi:small subunit ribosomal protein S3